MSWAPPRISTIVARASKWAQPQKIVLQVGAPQALNCYDVHGRRWSNSWRSNPKLYERRNSCCWRSLVWVNRARCQHRPGDNSVNSNPVFFVVVCRRQVCCGGVLLRRCFVYFFWKSKQIGAYWFRKLISTISSSSDSSWCVQCKLLNIHFKKRLYC